MSRWCLDTSAYSQFMRGHQDVVALLDAADWVGVSAIVLGELRSGFLLGARASDNDKELASFLRNPVVEVLDIDEHAARIFAEIVVALRAAGTPVPTNDIWIAAVAAREGASVISFDAHFRSIQRVGSTILKAG